MRRFIILLNFSAPFLGGIAIGHHFGVFDGIVAGIVIWALIPWAKI